MTEARGSPGLLLVLSAPSGAGKTSLALRLMKEMAEAAVFSVSYTTRPPRGGERNGEHYHFVDALTFQKKIDLGDFVEWAEVHGHFYGSPQASVDRVRASGGIAVFDIDVQGGNAIKRKYPDAVLVFVLPPSIEELERRLRDRRTETEDTLRGRLLAARSEIDRGVASYDYIIVNDDFERAFEDLVSVIRAERCRRERIDLTQVKLDRSP
jgi:guanylate kinase